MQIGAIGAIGRLGLQGGRLSGLPIIGGEPPLRAWDFEKGLLAGLTFSRASSATIQNPDGTWTTVGSDVRRVENGRLVMEGAQTNLLLNSAALATQSVAVTAQVYTLSFQGTGSVTLSGAATGTLNGTGAANRVRLIFTPSAGTLTLTVTGSVTFAMLRTGGAADEGMTSWIPTTGAAATRAADVLALSLAGLDLSTGFWVVARGMRYEATSLLTATERIYQFDNGDNHNRLFAVKASGSSNVSFEQFSSNVQQGSAFRSNQINVNLNVATRFALNNYAHVWGDGTTITDLVAAYTTPTQLFVGRAPNGSGPSGRMTLRGIYLFSPSITPAQMAAYVTGLPT